MIILMPLYQSGSLKTVLTDKTITAWNFNVVLQLSTDVFTALAVIHKANVVHSDIKS